MRGRSCARFTSSTTRSRGQGAAAYDRDVPLETRVEREPVPRDLPLHVSVTRYFFGLVRSKASLDFDAVRPRYLADYPLTEASLAGFVGANTKALLPLASAGTLDGGRLLDEIASGAHATRVDGLPGLTGAQRSDLKQAGADLAQWFGRLYAQPAGFRRGRLGAAVSRIPVRLRRRGAGRAPDGPHGRRVRDRPPRLVLLRRRRASRGPARAGGRGAAGAAGARGGSALVPAGSGLFRRDAQPPLLGDGGPKDRVRRHRRQHDRRREAPADRVRPRLRQRLVRHPVRGRGRFGLRGPGALGHRRLRRADPRPRRRAGRRRRLAALDDVHADHQPRRREGRTRGSSCLRR